MPVLEIRNLQKQFDGHTVLGGISFPVEKGDVIAVIGPSGAGKTTMLRCMNFLERADAGALCFDGADYNLSKISKHEIAAIRKRTAFVFQNYNLFANKTALQNVTEGLITARRMKRKEAEEIGRAALAKVGLSDRAAARPNELSGGQQQRVAIARAIATDPEVIYFDEPTSALDPELTGEVLTVMRKLAEEGMTMIVVTHEMAFAKNVANRVLFLVDGQILEEGDPATFFDAPATDRAREFLNGLGSF